MRSREKTGAWSSGEPNSACGSLYLSTGRYLSAGLHLPELTEHDGLLLEDESDSQDSLESGAARGAGATSRSTSSEMGSSDGLNGAAAATRAAATTEGSGCVSAGSAAGSAAGAAAGASHAGAAAGASHAGSHDGPGIGRPSTVSREDLVEDASMRLSPRFSLPCREDALERGPFQLSVANRILFGWFAHLKDSCVRSDEAPISKNRGGSRIGPSSLAKTFR